MNIPVQIIGPYTEHHNMYLVVKIGQQQATHKSISAQELSRKISGDWGAEIKSYIFLIPSNAVPFS